jgi:protein-S-isoprenylcysteine O-methyltransferase Ste14
LTAGPAASLLWATVLVENAVYGLLLGLRMRASRRGRAPVSTSPPVSPAPSGPVAQHHVAGRNASLVLVVISVTAAVYYGSLLLWLYRPSILGSSVLASSWPMYAVGVVVSTCGLSLMGWSYAVFRSWRWRAEVEPGHLLMTEGPFARTRHPIYLSFALFYVGAFFLMPYLVFALHAVASFVAYDYRAGIEERVMIDAFGDDYRRYRDRTHRYIPGVY